MKRFRVAALSTVWLLAPSPGCAARTFRTEAPEGSPCAVGPSASGRLAGHDVAFAVSDDALATTVGLRPGERAPFEALVATSVIGWRCGRDDGFDIWDVSLFPTYLWYQALTGAPSPEQRVPLDRLVPPWVEPGAYVLGLTVDAAGLWGVPNVRSAQSWQPAPGRAIVRVAIEVPVRSRD